MTPEQKTLVQETWRHVVPIADTAASLFYDRLFQIDPTTRVLFAGVDLESQRKKLMQALALVVGALDRIDDLVPTIADLGRRHTTYGVTDTHYDSVGAALLWTLEQGLGDAWTAEAEAAWAAAYGLLSSVMRCAANEATAATAATAANGANTANDTTAPSRRAVA